MNEDRDRIDLATEERLRRAVRFRDAEVTTSPDALTRIRARAAQRPRSGRWHRPGPLIGVAAALVLVIGGVTYALQGDDDSPDVATDTSTDPDPTPEPAADPEPTEEPTAPASTLLPATTTLPPPTTTNAPLPQLTATERAELGLVVWPLDSRSFQDPTTLAFSYATQALGIADPSLELQSDEDGLARIAIPMVGEDGQPFGEATRLELVSLDDFNWVIVEARSEEVRLSSIVLVEDGLATVSGTGRSFEGAARIVARSVCDPEGVITPVQIGGGPEFGDFSQLAAFVPCPDFPLVIELATEEVLDNAVPSVAAVAHYSEPVELTWSVMRVEADDVLNVRSGPGVQNDIVTTLAPDATGIEMISRESESVNGDPWRQIRTPDGVNGWVNFTYLTAQSTPDATTGALAVDLLTQLAGGEPGPWTPAIGDRGVWLGGIGVYADAPTPFIHVSAEEIADDSSMDFNPFPGEPCDRECTVSPSGFVVGSSAFDDTALDRLPGLVTTDEVGSIGFDEQFLFGPLDQLDLFDSLHSVTIELPGTEEFGQLDWRRYHLWFDWSDGQPKVIAIWRWGWTP